MCHAGLSAQEEGSSTIRPGSFDVVVMTPAVDGGTTPSLVSLATLPAFLREHPEHRFQLRDDELPSVNALLWPAGNPPAFSTPTASIKALPDGNQEVTMAGQEYDDTAEWTHRYVAKKDGVEPLEQRAVDSTPLVLLAHGLPSFPKYFVGGGAFVAGLIWLRRRPRNRSH
jgi:hypothetical protein